MTLLFLAVIIPANARTAATFHAGTTKNSCAVADYIRFRSDRNMADAYLSGLFLAFASGLPVQMIVLNDCVDHSVSLTLI